MLKTVLISLAVFFMTLTVGTNAAFAVAVKANKQAAKGCIPRISQEQAAAELKKFNIKTINAKPEEIRTLGTGLFWVEKLADNKPLTQATAKGNGYSFHFYERSGVSRQTGSEIQISRNGAKQYGQNVAQLIHELGHFVGNNGAYAEYRTAMKGKRCSVSSYSNASFGENFAENFAAFVTNPALIKNSNNAGCKASYEFFSKKLFVRGDLADNCALGHLKADDYNM